MGDNYLRLQALFRTLDLHTVCEEAHCPNIGECWGGGTATLMLMGDTCTRGCRFCNVKTGNPHGSLDLLEPDHVAEALAQLGLEYVVLTSVDRDDLPDGGATHFARAVRAIKGRCPDLLIEVLIPDFQGDANALRTVVEARPDVLGHNLETVEALTAKVRDPRATYRQSLRVLADAKQLNPNLYTKSSVMLGLGETEDQLRIAFRDLRAVHVDFLTLGQYLQPSRHHLIVQDYVPPERFQHYRQMAEEMGFRYVVAGPLVRSSYRAGEFFIRNVLHGPA